MADLERRSGRGLTRRQREQRAFVSVVLGGGAAVVAVVGFVLAVAGVIGATLPIIAMAVAFACLIQFRRAVRA